MGPWTDIKRHDNSQKDAPVLLVQILHQKLSHIRRLQEPHREPRDCLPKVLANA